ncbi:MAP kinase-activated protein kinase 2 (Fragment) (Partial), partial [Seminavis robusta]
MPTNVSSKSLSLEMSKQKPTSISIQPKDFVRHHNSKDSTGAGVFDTYSVGRRLGSGGYGSVYGCRHKQTGVERAMKVMTKKRSGSSSSVNGDNADISGRIASNPKVDLSASQDKPCGKKKQQQKQQQQQGREIREFHAAKKMDHPNCVSVYECFEDSRNVYIVMDLFEGGNMLSALTSNLGCLMEANAALLVNSILSTVNYCHTHLNMVHLDLKLENVMFETDSYKFKDAKIIDWGLAKPVAIDANGNLIRFRQVVGSTSYMCPEVFQASYDPYKQDIWSIGVMTFIMMSGYPPFNGSTEHEVMTSVLMHSEQTMEQAMSASPVWDTVSDEAKDFIMSLMAFDEKDRPTAAQALQHPWLQGIRANASMAQDLAFQQDPMYRKALQSVFGSLVRSSVVAKRARENGCGSSTLIWRKITAALLVSQYGIMGATREVLDDCFRAMDTNLDGVLTQDGFHRGLERFYPHVLSRE